MNEMDNERWREFMNTAMGAPPNQVTVAAVRRRLVRRRMREGAGVLAVVAASAVGVTVGVQAFSTSPGPAVEGSLASPTVYAVYQKTHSSTVIVPISVATGKPSKAIRLNVNGGLAVTPNGRTLYAGTGNTVTPIDTATGTPGRPIHINMNRSPFDIVMDPDGQVAYATSYANGLVPINPATNTAGTPIHVELGVTPAEMAFTPSGKTAYVITNRNTVTPLDTVTGQLGRPIHVGYLPTWIDVTPNGKTVYVMDNSVVTPISTATNKAGKSIRLTKGAACCAMKVSPDGKIAYVGGNDVLTPISTATNKAGKPIHVGITAEEVVFTPNGKTAYVGDFDGGPGRVVPIDTATSKAGKPINIGSSVYIAISPDGKTLYAATQNEVIPISTATNKPGKPISVGAGSPTQIVIAP